jgi:hypothetical protein
MKVKKIDVWLLDKPQFKFIEPVQKGHDTVLRLLDYKIFSTHDLQLPKEQRIFPTHQISLKGLTANVYIRGWITKFHPNCIHVDFFRELVVTIDKIGHISILLHNNSVIQINALEETMSNFKGDAIEYLIEKLEMVNGMGAKEK